jgi:outer membrane PBP1 activator LpoA protein
MEGVPGNHCVVPATRFGYWFDRLYRRQRRSIMKRILCVVMLAVLFSGCSGVLLNAEYSGLLDKTASWSASMSVLAEADNLTDEQKNEALKGNAMLWQRFRDARDGKEGAQ